MGGTAVCMVVHDDHWLIEHSLKSFEGCGPIYVFVSRLAWNGSSGKWRRTVQAAKAMGAIVIVGDWPDESLHRSHALAEMKRMGFSHIFIPDGDEVISEELKEQLLRLASVDAGDIFTVRMRTYWRSTRYQIMPPEEIAPVLMIDCRTCQHIKVREYVGKRPVPLGEQHGVLYHLSYVGPNERIARKLATWGHRDEVVPDWFRRVWLGWDPLMTNLHPTAPPCYGIAVPGPIPEALRGIPLYHDQPDPGVPINWPRLSIIIALYGGEEEIRRCLESIARCLDLIDEVAVIDDASPDGAAEVARSFPFVKLLSNETNQGFAKTNNYGYRETTGDVVLFLNSDTQVTRACLIRLIGSLIAEPSIAAAGSLTNNAGYGQATPVSYHEEEGFETFSRDFANRQGSLGEDRDTGMLVGFAMAVKRSVLEHVGLFDPRFEGGLFEDNDLSYRIVRAGYRLVVSSRSFIHHEGSRSLARVTWNVEQRLNQNKGKFEVKHIDDVESGFCSHLSGKDSPLPIVFDQRRNPDKLRRSLAPKRDLADITLCVIARDEERCIGDLLQSAQGIFREIIVVDTGSKDRTVEIAKSFPGVKVYKSKWRNSFSHARNVSLKHANGKWVFWMDADDVLSLRSAETILDAAINAPKEVVGFIVPVQFVEGGPYLGTRVDHLKLFRNLPGAHFQFRIHEQVFPSLRALGEIRALEGAVVHHVNYDVSPEGQARKRIRDWKLLKLDLKENPGNPFVLFNCGMTALFTGQFKKAVKWLNESIANSTPTESQLRKAYVLLARAHLALDDTDKAMEALDKGLTVVGDDPEMYFVKGNIHAQLSRPREAKEAHLKVGQSDMRGVLASYDRSILGYQTHHCLGDVCFACGEYHEAVQWWRAAITESPRPWESAVNMFAAAARTYDFETAREAAQIYLDTRGPDEQFRHMEAALPPPEQHAPASQQSPNPEMVAVRRLLEAGRDDDAMPALQRLNDRGVAEAAFCQGVYYNRRKDYRRALAYFERALQLDPTHAQTAEEVRRLRRFLVM